MRQPRNNRTARRGFARTVLDPYAAGANACIDGKRLADCPRWSPKRREAWRQGYRDACGDAAGD